MRHAVTILCLALAVLSAPAQGVFGSSSDAVSPAGQGTFHPGRSSQLSPLTSQHVLIFDLGTKDSPLFAGAERVTPEDARWRSAAGLRGHDAPGGPRRIYTNALNEDSILGDTANSFRFQVPAGTWHVYVLAGVGADYPQAQYWDFDVTVGAESWTCRMISPAHWGYAPQHHEFRLTTDGAIAVKLSPRSKWALSGLVAWPEGEDAAARAVIAKLEQWAPEEEMAKWQEDVRPPAGPAPTLAPADQERGFYIWHREWANPIYPWTNPAPGEMNPTLRIFAAPGEYEPLTFTVRPLRTIRHAGIALVPLGPVPVDRIDVRKVRYLRGRSGYEERGRYRIIPDILDRWQSGPLPADENATFWLTVHVPDGARPGLYRSQVTFAADGHRVAIPVLLRVLDVRLQDDPEQDYGIYYDDPITQVSRAPDAASRAYWLRRSELEHADMAAHGTKNVILTCWSPAADAQGHFDLSTGLASLDAQLSMAQRFGFHAPFMVEISTDSIYEKYTHGALQNHLKDVKMPPDAFFTEVTALVRTIDAERKRRGWPEFVYQPFDEPSQDPDVVRFMARLCAAVKAAGVPVYVTAAPEKPGYEPMKPYVDVWCTQTFLPDRKTVLADLARGVHYWCYPNDVSGELDHTIVAGARMTYGFGFWRSGFQRLIPWIYQANGGDPFNYLDDGMMDFLVRSEPDGTPLPTALWEAYREGYDDLRYAYTLQQTIARAKTSPSAQVHQEAEAAQQALDAVWQAVPVLPQYRFTGFWSPEEMNVRRWMLADHLERLTVLLRSTR